MVGWYVRVTKPDHLDVKAATAKMRASDATKAFMADLLWGTTMKDP
jgi:hypothetical protein